MKTARILKSLFVPGNEKNPEGYTLRSRGPNGDAGPKPQGSYFLGMLSLLIAVPTDFGEIVVMFTGLCARLRVDGTFVIDPPDIREDDWEDKDGEYHTGSRFINFPLVEGNTAFAEWVASQNSILRKRLNSARAYNSKKAASA